jgi:hypothetical protein
VPLHPSEIDFRRRWYQAHRQQFESDPAAERELLAGQAGFARSATEALDHLSTLRRSGDLEAFRAAMQAWAVKPDTLAFNGFAGQMLLNQLVKRSEDAHQLAVLLADCLTVPTSDDDAVTRIRAMVDQIESVRTGGQPAPRSAVFLLSYFWAMADRRWPIGGGRSTGLVQPLSPSTSLDSRCRASPRIGTSSSALASGTSIPTVIGSSGSPADGSASTRSSSIPSSSTAAPSASIPRPSSTTISFATPGR